jgi:L-lactate dehydrogenase
MNVDRTGGGSVTLRSQPRPLKVVVVGAGQVGSTFAYAMLLEGVVGEIVLIDINRERAEGEAMDLNHAVPLSHSIRIRVGDYPDCAGADIVAIAAGVSQRPGESRVELLQRNAAIFRQIVPRITAHNGDGILLVATNPVDVLSYVAWKVSGFPPQRVIGSGTVLDTARFRYLLGQHLGVDPRSVHAYIVGEHGDSEVPVWSLANVGGMRLDGFCAQHGCELTPDVKGQLFGQTRDAAYEIINRKGATYYAVAVGLLRIAEAILRDQRTVLSVSSLVPGYYGIDDVYLSLPAVVARQGVQDVLHLGLSIGETEDLRRSAAMLRGLLDELDVD